ncbi:MAG: DUF2617 family protein [Parcubacteria group bacterium]|nr:DUF2617 family protein [Parcubacteria group bacterium]MBI3075085.1 DUF2617 family protein [Parcubacteria group bacterium]
MNGNGYVDQSANDLVLCIYDGTPVLTEDVRVFREQEAEIAEGITVRLGIIGASHLFSCSVESSFSMTEMLACSKPLAFNGFLLHAPLAMLARGRKRIPLAVPFPGGEYSFRGYIQNASEGTLARVAQLKNRMKEGASKDGSIVLSYDFSDFDGGNTEHAFPPETLVYFSWVPGGPAQLYTVHTYPNEGKLAFTKSVLRIRLKKNLSRA